MNTATENFNISPFPEGVSAEEILHFGVEFARGPLALACSFSVEDVVLIDLIRELEINVGIFALDTGRLHEETYEIAESVSERYGVQIDWYFPERDAVEDLAREKGLFSFRQSLENRHECCRIRKVEPLGRALANFSGWITGIRREQSITRAEVAPIEIDACHGDILKINPLVSWRETEVRDYAKRKRIPMNQLHNQGFPSIGCAPCTRAVKPGEDPRAGRWWWENPEHKECGLHRR